MYAVSTTDPRVLFSRDTGHRSLVPEPAGVDAQFLDPVLDDPFGRPQKSGRLRLVAAGLLQGADDQCTLLGFDGGVELALLLYVTASRP